MAAGAGAHDQRDLRDHAGGVHVAPEDLAVQAERDDALLDARAGALVDADDRAAGLDGEVHHLGDLLAVDLAERAAEDREVLGEHADLAAVDGAVAGDHAVAVRPVLLQAERRSSGAGPARRARRRSPRRRASRSARGRSGGPSRAASRPPWPSPAWTASSRRRSRSASLPAVVWMSMSVGDVGALAGLCLLRSPVWPPPGCSWANLVPVTADARRRAHPSTSDRLADAPTRLAVEVRRRRARPPTRWSPTAPAPGAAEGLVVVAEHQTAGRGRLDRTWETPARSALTFSVLLRPDASPPSLAVAAAADRATPSAARCAAGARRRPQVAQRRALDDRKVAGILVERVETPDGPAAVVGIGINVDHDRATSCRSRPPRRSRSRPASTVDRTDLLLGAAARRCATEYDAWQVGGDAATAARGVRRRLRDGRPRRSGSTCPPASTAHRPRRSASTPAAGWSCDGPTGRRRPSAPATSCTCVRRLAPGDMILAWPSRRSCSTRVSTSSSTPAPTPRRCCCRVLVFLIVRRRWRSSVDRSIDDAATSRYGVWVVVVARHPLVRRSGRSSTGSTATVHASPTGG